MFSKSYFQKNIKRENLFLLICKKKSPNHPNFELRLWN